MRELEVLLALVLAPVILAALAREEIGAYLADLELRRHTPKRAARLGLAPG